MIPDHPEVPVRGQLAGADDGRALHWTVKLRHVRSCMAVLAQDELIMAGWKVIGLFVYIAMLGV